LKVVVLHIGARGDYGWTYEGHLGAEKMAEALPYVELSQKQQACNADAPDTIRQFA